MTGEAGQLLSRPAFVVRRILIALFVLLFPFYLFPSGAPQISSAAVALACLLSWRQFPAMIDTSDRRVLLPLFLFIGYTILVNGWYSATAWNGPLTGIPLVRGLHYIFNYGLFCVVLLHLRQGGARELLILMGAVLGSLLLQTVVSVETLPDGMTRVAGGFNNPNQLGYFALTSLVMGAAVVFSHTSGVVWTTVFIVSCLYLVTLSLSHAAIGSVVVLGIVATVVAWRSRRSILATMAAAALAFGVVAVLSPGINLVEVFRWRASRFEGQLRNLAEDRRLVRFRDHYGYVVLGAGEGLSERFDRPGEVHSTPGTLLFSYGVPGTVLFTAFLVGMVRHDALKSGLLLTPLLTYGLVHNGLRFPWFWLCLCVIYYCSFAAASAEPARAAGTRARST